MMRTATDWTPCRILSRVWSERNGSRIHLPWPSERDRIFIDQKTEPFAREAFRIVDMDEEIP